MKHLTVLMLFIFWGIVSLVAICTVIGVLLLFSDEWMEIPKKLMDKL